MTREDIYKECIDSLKRSNCILLEAATGVGKSAISLKVCNHILSTYCRNIPKPKINILLLVAKRVHKQTWKEEIEKWGGINTPDNKSEVNLCFECYESLFKHYNEKWDIVIADEVHHIGSETRLEILKNISFTYFMGLSATIPFKVKQYFIYNYHAKIVSFTLTEAIEDAILPEPEILLFPLQLDNTQYTETWEINARSTRPVIYGSYKELWKYKKDKIHAVLSCTQKQKSNELDALIKWEKDKYMATRNKALEQFWLFHCGQRLEYYASIKIPIIKAILEKINKHRSITFCKTIEQCEQLGRWCIHSKNSKADIVYKLFNQKKIDHISTVNILNENANLVDCKYAIFDNLSSSNLVVYQRLGRSLRHKHPVIIMPFYKGTREEELVDKLSQEVNKDYIHLINSIEDI